MKQNQCFQVTQCSAKSKDWSGWVWAHSSKCCGLSVTTNLLKHGRSYWSTLVLALLTCLQTAARLRLAVQVVHNALVRPRKLQACCHANMGFFCTMSDMLQQYTCVSDVNYFESLIFFENVCSEKVTFSSKNKFYGWDWIFYWYCFLEDNRTGNAMKAEGRVRLSDDLVRGLVTGQSMPRICFR